MGRACMKADKKGKTLQEVSGLVKDREALWILLIKTETWKGDNRLEGGGGGGGGRGRGG